VTAIFITATGTDVGKTFVAASLIRHLREMGRDVEAIKPIVVGYEPAQAAASDPGVLLAALGLPFSPEAVERISPWRFGAGLSPELAARHEGRDIDVDHTVAHLQVFHDRDPAIEVDGPASQVIGNLGFRLQIQARGVWRKRDCLRCL